MFYKKAGLKKEIDKNKFYVFLAFLIFILLAINLVVWHIIRTATISQIHQKTLASAHYYANEIELKNGNIKLVLEEIAKGSSKDPLDAPSVWNTQTNLYIKNYKGIEDIVLVDTDFEITNIASENEGDYSIGQKVKDLPRKKEYLYSYTPVYEESNLLGFVFSKVSIVDIVLSVFWEDLFEYEIKIITGNDDLYVSDNWNTSNDSFLEIQNFNLRNANLYKLKIKPTVEWKRINMRHTNLILIFGFFLILGIGIVAVIAQRLNHKSKLLLTSQMELKEKNQALNKQLRDQQKLESIGVLASGVAHEINSPINGVINYSQLIMDKEVKDSESFNYSKEIIAEMKRISDLVSNILYFSRKGRVQGFSYARIEDILQRSVNLVSTIIKKDNIEIDIDINDNLPQIKCRSQQIQQVIMNLLFNSKDSLNEKYKKYHEDKKILVTAKTVYIYEKIYMRVTVKDWGIGIDESIQSKIFEQFFTTKGEKGGTGLGLSISYSIAKEHGGNLSFESKKGIFTMFHLDIPID